MSSTDQQPEAFSSHDALRRGNDELLANLPEDDAPQSERVRAANESRIRDFIRRAVVTGALLDTPQDRRAAQGLIDYWVASSYSSRGSAQTRPISDRTDIQLRPFDASMVKEIADRGDAAIKDLSAKDRELARRILLRLFRFPDTGGNCVSSPAIRDSLLALGDTQRVAEIIDRMVKAGVLTVTPTPQGDVVELRYEALMRQWEKLRLWIDQRAKFRDAALFWLRSGRNKGALLSGRLAREARLFGQLNATELAFVDASRAHAFRLRLAAITVAVLLVGGLPSSQWLYANYYVPWRKDAVLARIKSPASDAQQKSADIRWLAFYGNRLELDHVELDSVDLSEMVASQPTFTTATLRNVKFDKADLVAASFTESIVEDARFANAKLKSARFKDSRITSTTFSGAKLRSAVFDGARLCDVDFSGADISLASFKNVTFDDDNVSKFKGTAWWLATGWSTRQREALGKAFVGEDYEATAAFRDLVKEFDVAINNAPDRTIFRARTLNDKAWLLATYGVGLDLAAETIGSALAMIAEFRKDQPGNPELLEDEANFKDTYAYLLMQKSELGKAVEILDAAIKVTQDASVTFRYALALFVQGNNEERALALLKKSLAEYFPEQELHLLKTHIKGKFLAEVEEQGRKLGEPSVDATSGTAEPPPPCPGKQPSK